MNITLALYLIDILDKFSVVSLAFWVLALFPLAMLLVAYISDQFHEDCLERYRSYIKITLIFILSNLVIFLLLPSQKTMYLMASSEIAKEIVNNPEVKKISDKILIIVNDKLDELTKKEGK